MSQPVCSYRVGSGFKLSSEGSAVCLVHALRAGVPMATHWAPLTSSIQPIKPMAATAGSCQGAPARPGPSPASSRHMQAAEALDLIHWNRGSKFLYGRLPLLKTQQRSEADVLQAGTGQEEVPRGQAWGRCIWLQLSGAVYVSWSFGLHFPLISSPALRTAPIFSR